MTTINLISGPRNISTALMYSFAQRNDTTVVDEPFYAVYLRKVEVDHPSKEEVMASLPGDEGEVRRRLSESKSPVLFVKNMAHHMEALEVPLIPDATNVFLIRNPAMIISSYAQVIDTPVMRDIGIEYQYELFLSLQQEGVRPIVVDSGHLLENPRAVLEKLCAACGLSFQQRMLHWPAGPKPFDGVWSTHWYANVHASTGFTRPPADIRKVPEHLISLYERACVFYEKLLAFSLKA